MRELTQPNPLPPAPALSVWRDAALLGACGLAFSGLPQGQIRLIMPSGRGAIVGRRGSDLMATLRIHSFDTLWRAMRRGPLGFAEAYMRGECDCDDLAGLFKFFIDNRPAFNRIRLGLFRASAADRAYHVARDNTREGSARNIAEHYDLGNDFYALWLDPSMTYSSAIFEEADESLEAAQARKYAHVLAALGVEPGHNVLEVGCGWGGFAAAAASRGARVRAITVSRAQEAYARMRLESHPAAGGQAEVVFEDYRDTAGSFDRIASIEMIEAVGERHWPNYFRMLHDRLKPGGIAVVQAITIRESSRADYCRSPDFIQRYIFPGGMLPTVSSMAEVADEAGLRFEPVETFGKSYAETLRRWRRRFDGAWPEIEPLGFDDRFRRMWHYYLTYCEAGFDRGVINVGLYRMTRTR